LAHCAEITPLLSAFKDGELPPVETEQVTLHLQNCLTCRETLLDFVLLGHHLQNALAMPSLENFADGVMAAIGTSQRPLRQRLLYRLEQLREQWVAGIALAGVTIATASLILVLVEPQTVNRFSGIVRSPAVSNELAQKPPVQTVKLSPPANFNSAANQDSQTFISRIESRHPSVATWSEPDDKTTVIWLGDDNSGND
jgi:anti-sigma factor RsiW